MQSTENLYDSSIDTIFAEAWMKTNTIKAVFLKACVSIVLAMVIAVNLRFTLAGIIIPENNIFFTILIALIQIGINICLFMPLLTGLLMICIKHCTGIPAPINNLFQYFHYWKRLWVFPIVFTAVGYLAALLANYDTLQIILFFASIVWGIIYFMHIPLMVEKNYPLTAAMTLSRKAILQNWSHVLGLLVAILIIVCVSLLTAGIAFIWTLPWIANAIAIFYRELFGIQISLV